MSTGDRPPGEGVGSGTVPTVTVVVPAYNYGRYLGEALDSVLGQDYPAERVEAIVIDDGSTDDTAAVAQRYVDRFPGRVRLISQENRGYVGAVNRGIEEADGELLALLDADDAWMPGKLRRQVEMLQSQPELGLVFGDLIAVDDRGHPYQRPTILSSLEARHPVPRRAAARILYNNEALESTIVVRRELVSPVPEDLPIADWWITLQAALVSEIDWVREPIVHYRIHGENMSTGQHQGVGQAQRPDVFVRDILWKLRALRRIDLTGFSPVELAYVWTGVEDTALQAILASSSPYVPFTGELELDSERSAELVAKADEAARREDHESEIRYLFEALVWNPYAAGVRIRLNDVLLRVESVAAERPVMAAAAEAAAPAEAAEVPNPLDGARSVVILTDAEELLAGDEMLSAYASAMDGVDVATLAIDASRLPAQSAEEDLAALVSRCGLADREDIDMLAVIGPQGESARERMLSGAVAHYRREPGVAMAGDGASLPEFSPQTISGLRDFVERQWPAVNAAGGDQ